MRHFNVDNLHVVVITNTSLFQKKSFASAKPTFPIRTPYWGPFHFGPVGVFLWNVVFSLKDPKWTSPSFLSCILCWVVSSSWDIDPNSLRLDLHTGPQERQRTWRGKKRVNCSSYWKFTEGQMKTWMEQEEEERPMICRQKQEKRSVKMVVQDLPRPDWAESKESGSDCFFNPHSCFSNFLQNSLFAFLLQIFVGSSCCYYTTTSQAQKFIWVLQMHGTVLWFLMISQRAICCKAVGFANICQRAQLSYLMIASWGRTFIVRHKLLYETMKGEVNLPFC